MIEMKEVSHEISFIDDFNVPLSSPLNCDTVQVQDGKLENQDENMAVRIEEGEEEDDDQSERIAKKGDGVASEDSGSGKISALNYFYFFVVGCGLELPYHALITAYDYFALFDGENAEFIITLAFDPTALATFFLLMKYDTLGSEFAFMFYGFLAELLLLLSVNLFDFFPTVGTDDALSSLSGSLSETYELNWTYIVVTVVCMMLIGALTASVSLTAFKIAGKMPPVCLQALMTGIGISGLIVSILRVINKASLPNNDHGTIISAHIYFVICAAVISLCIFSYLQIRKLQLNTQAPQELHDGDDVVKEQGLSEDVSSEIQVPNKPQWVQTFRDTMPMFLVVVFTYLTTFTVFPGLISLIESEHESLNVTNWFSAILITLFNLGNFIGSALTEPWLQYVLRKRKEQGDEGVEKPGKHLWIFVVMRLPIVMLLTFCYKPYFFFDDWPVYLLVALLAVSNGWIGSLGVVYGPDYTTPDQRETASIIVSTGYNIGIATGTTLGFFIFGLL